MEKVTLGFLLGAIAASIVLHVAGIIGRTDRPRVFRFVLEIGILVALVVLAWIWPHSKHEAIHWLQISLGAVAGFVFRGWIAFAVREIVVRPERLPDAAVRVPTPFPPPEPMMVEPETAQQPAPEEGPGNGKPGGNGGGKSWWGTEPWRGLTLIAILIIAAFALPQLSEFIRQYNLKNFEFGLLKLEVTRSSAVLRGLTRDENRRSTGATVLTNLADRDGTLNRLASDRRFLEHTAMGRPDGARILKEDGKGTMAFQALFISLLQPVASCTVAMYENSLFAGRIQEFAARFAREYRALLDSAREARAVAGNTNAAERSNASQGIRVALGRLRETGHKLLAENDGLSAGKHKCDASLVKGGGGRSGLPSVEQLTHLDRSSQSYLALADLHLLGGARLAAIDALSGLPVRFSYNMNIPNRLTQLWYIEGHSAAMAVQASRRFLQVAEDFKRFSDAAKGAGAKDDAKRGKRALALAQNSWAYHVSTLGEAVSSGEMSGAVRAARASVETQFELQIDTASAKRNPLTAMIQLELDKGRYLWSAVDTYAAALLAEAAVRNQADENAPCIVKMFELAMDWYASRLRDLIEICTAGTKCDEFRSKYAMATHSFEVISGHFRIAKDSFEKHGAPKNCEPDRGRELLPMLWPSKRIYE